MDFKLTFDLLPVLGVVLMLCAYYVPGFKTWYEKLSPEWKQGFMLISLLVVDVVVVVLSVFGVIAVYPVEWKAAIMAGVVDFVIALTVNTGAYKSANRINDRISGKSDSLG